MAYSASRELVNAILHTPTPLPSIRQIFIQTSHHGVQQTPLRHFIKNRLPVVKYHNAQIETKVLKIRQVCPPLVRMVKLVDNDENKAIEEEFVCKDMHESDVLKRIMEFNNRPVEPTDTLKKLDEVNIIKNSRVVDRKFEARQLGQDQRAQQFIPPWKE